MRLIVGLDAPTGGTVTVAGRLYRSLRRPLFEVGAMLESAAVHPGRSARAHLRALAQANGIGRRRVDRVLAMVGLDGVARRRCACRIVRPRWSSAVRVLRCDLDLRRLCLPCSSSVVTTR
jgi:ABC-type nitrate/sulfonate/bicarbonate transport system ATPase subunit